jgi:hypothetical protein
MAKYETFDSQSLYGLGLFGRFAHEFSFWGGIAVAVWVGLAVLGAAPTGAGGPSEWAALALSGIAVLAASYVKLKERRRRSRAAAVDRLRQQSPLGLIDVLRDYGVRELGALFLYYPIPRRARDRDAWAWLELLEAQEFVGPRSWRIEADKADAVRRSHPHLFEGGVQHFEVFRLDRRVMEMVMDEVA